MSDPSRLLLLCAVAAAVLLSACGHDGVRLAPGERAALAGQPAIHVLHYQSPPPTLKVSSKNPPPDAAVIRRAAGVDPAALVATGFSRLLGRKEKLRNLQPVTRALPRPVAASAATHPLKVRRGLTLELWLDHWTFEAVAGQPGQYGLRLVARSRLSRLDDGRTLWSTGHCRVGGPRARDYRLAAADLGNAVRLRKLLTAAGNECARQLARDFDTPPEKPG